MDETIQDSYKEDQRKNIDMFPSASCVLTSYSCHGNVLDEANFNTYI